MIKYVNIYKIIILIIVIIIVISCVSYNIGISAVSKEDKPVTIEIEENNTYLSIAEQLKENNLIRSQTFYKIYVRIFKPNNLQVGSYNLNENMSVKELINNLENNATNKNPTFVIQEGKHITDIALAISEATDLKEKELLDFWGNKDFINTLIDKYWFIDENVKNQKLKYNLEGYFFPATYKIKENSTKEETTYMMLDKMDEVLTNYKTEIENSKFSVHEILTLASIVENEAILDKERPIIAGVFINRLNIDMPLQSCATIGYAIGQWKLSYTNKDLAVDSPYNTYKYYGLPVGPGNMPGENSIKAVLYPNKNDYLFFVANVFDSENKQSYFSKTYSEHQEKCLDILGKSC